VGERVVGTIQMAGTEMIRIADLKRMEAQVDVGESDVVRVSLNDSVWIEVDAYPGKKFKGIVREIANSSNSSLQGLADQGTNFAVKIRLLNESYAELSAERRYPFRPGMSTSVEILTSRAENILSVPIAAVTVRAVDADGKIINENDKDEEEDAPANENASDRAKKEGGKLQEVIFLFEAGKMRTTAIKTGIQDDRFIEISEGISDSAQVITAPFSAISKKLKDDMKVEKVAKDKLFDK